MATSSKLTEEYLTCIICSDVFTNPATLQCDHTFCRRCLLKYTKTQHEAIQAKSIPCPICRQLTKVTSPEAPVDEWINDVKLSRTMQGLMEDFGPVIDTKDSITCSACQEAGEATPATVWCTDCEAAFCDTCARYHRRMPISRSHDVQELSETIRIKPPQRFICKVHEEEQIKLFCRDCKKAICHLCCGIDHRTCKTVVTIKEILPEIKSSLLAKKRHLDKQISLKSNKIGQLNSRINEIAEETTKAGSDIALAIKQVKQVLLAKQKRLMAEMEKTQNDKVQQLKADVKSFEIEKIVHQEQSQLIDQAVESESQKDIFDIYNRFEAGYEQSPTDTETEMTSKLPDRIGFTWDKVHLSKFVNEVKIGEFYSIKVGDVGRKSSPFLSRSIDTMIKQDIDTPEISDVALINSNGFKILVLVDARNNSIRTFPSDDRQRGYILGLRHQPVGISPMKDSKVFVSSPGSKEILNLMVYPDLEVLTTIGTQRAYYGLDFTDQHTLVACGYDASRDKDQAAIDVLDLKGNVLRTHKSSVIQNPDFVCATRTGAFLVSDRNTKSVILISAEGKVSHLYKPTGVRALQQPRGIATTSTGDILLVDNDASKVIHLTPLGVFVRDILTSADGLHKPYGICIDNDGLVYVSCEHCVHVFVFK